LGDAMALGLATNAVESARMAELAAALEVDEPVDAVLRRFAIPAPAAPLMEHKTLIADIFAEESLPAIISKLSQAALGGSLFASQTLETMQLKSPTSMAIALEQVKRGATMGFADVMRMEYRIVCRIADGHDFYEGVRAVIVDKDQSPVWKPRRIEDIDPAAIAAHFAPLADDLVLE
jgi:enoyl-CoA hydratase